MLAERLLSFAVRESSKNYLRITPARNIVIPPPEAHKGYMLYMHIPFCTKLCPYCSFNRFPFTAKRAIPYFKALRAEMRILAHLGYDFESVYVGGGTPTVMIDELCDTLDLARELFTIKEVSSETNPNHLTDEILDKLEGRVQRLSVGVQSFDDGLLKQMDRYEKYGSSAEILERVAQAVPRFQSMNVDMIFNFPAQNEDILIHDVENVVKSGCTQATFYPLMASPSVEKSLAKTVGRVDYNREERFYHIIDELLTGGDAPLFIHSSAWTYNRLPSQSQKTNTPPAACTTKQKSAPANDPSEMIDEYVVQYEEYPAIGSGGITYLQGSLYVNTFSLREYGERIEKGHLSVMGKTDFNLRDRMRYRFLMQLFGLRLDKRQWEKDFGISVERGLPIEMAFMKCNGAFASNTADEITLTAKGRYLVVAMMRQFFIGVNNLRDQARAALPEEERELLFA